MHQQPSQAWQGNFEQWVTAFGVSILPFVASEQYISIMQGYNDEFATNVPSTLSWIPVQPATNCCNAAVNATRMRNSQGL